MLPPGATLVTDPADPRLDDYRALTDAALRKRYENQHGVFIAEGPNVVRRLLESSYRVRSVLVAPQRAAALADDLASLDVPVLVAERDVIDAVVRFRLHQGVIACGERPAPEPAARCLDGARRVAVLEAMNDHENMGVVFRSARAFGVDAVLLGPGSADPLYRRCVRVSMGHVLHVPHARVAALPAGLAPLRTAGFRLLALTPGPDAVPIDDVVADGPVALLLGAEGPGLSDAALAAADVHVRIPIDPAVDSLNVAAAAAIAFHVLR